MIRLHPILASPLVVISLACCAQTQTKGSSDPFSNEGVVLERSDTTYSMHADATGERDQHVRVRIQSNGAVQQFGVLAFSYASASETPVIKFARVIKPDGTIVETPVSDAIDMAAEVSREAPLYSDLKEMHLPIRSLSQGDTLEYEVDTIINKAETPGQFWGADHFVAPGTVVVLEEGLTLKVPADKYVQVWSPNHKPVVSEDHGVRTYTWSVAQLIPEPKAAADDATKPAPPKDPDEDAKSRKIPSVAWTTFHNWAEVGDWYRHMALERSEPTDAIRAKAETLTRDAKTPVEQVQALYGFVSTHTRYVGIDFGIGRYQPHTAADVLTNQYGDCKDKDTLLEALLRSKGFSTAPALIGAGIAPVPDVPSPAVFNHVITTVNLPAGKIWLDSTPPGAPFRYLSAIIRDQKALVVPTDSAGTLETTPASAPYQLSADFEAVAALDAEGKLTGKITSIYHDDDEVIVRAMARNLAPAEWDKVSQYISSSTGFGGTTSETRFDHADDISVPIAMTYTYTRRSYGDWDNNRIVPLMPALEFVALASDSKAPEEDIQLGAPRTLKATSHIRLPDGYHTDLPDPVHVRTDFATLDKTYRFDGKEILVDRTIVVLKEKLPKDAWKQYKTFTEQIHLDGEPWIQLIPPVKQLVLTAPKPAGDAAPSLKHRDTPSTVVDIPPVDSADTSPPETPSTSSAADLMNTATDRLRAGDVQGAREMLDKIKAKDPQQEGLWGAYAFIAQRERNNDEARADFVKELSLHPDDSQVVVPLARLQLADGDSVSARQTVQRYLTRHADNVPLSLYLAFLETSAEDYAAALKTLNTAAEQNPDNTIIRLQQSEALRRLGRKQEAAAAARSVLDGADDPEVLNDGAYTLGETGIDLPLAEQASRKGIQKLEETSASISAAEANSKAFAQATMLVASWDTLGWILYREGRLDEAKAMISSAWRASLGAEVGTHLAQIYAETGQKAQAASTYALAQAALTRNDAPDVRQRITEAIGQLKAAGVKSDPASPQALQDLRTYKIARPEGVGGWGTFRLEITTNGVIESQQMSGEKQIAGVKNTVDAMRFSELLPPGSKAHLLRSAVVSCSMGSTCEVVLVPDGGLQTEMQ